MYLDKFYDEDAVVKIAAYFNKDTRREGVCGDGIYFLMIG
jgi:hypothetical protein